MLTDPLKIAIPTATEVAAIRSAVTGVSPSNVASAAIIDVAPGSTQRQGLFSTSIFKTGIGHSNTKENAPYVTTRSLMRLDQVRTDSLGKSVTLSAYGVVAVPQGTLFTTAEVLSHAQALAVFMLLGSMSSALANYGNGNSTDLSRIINGEP